MSWQDHVSTAFLVTAVVGGSTIYILFIGYVLISYAVERVEEMLNRMLYGGECECAQLDERM